VVRKLVYLAVSILITALSLHLLISERTVEILLDALNLSGVGLFVGALLMVPVIQLARTWRFGILIGGGRWPATRALYRISTLTTFLGYLLPFRFGEFSFPLMAHHRLGLGLAHCTGIFLYTRMMDLLFLLVIGAGVILLFFADGWPAHWLAVGVVLFLLLLCGLLFLPHLSQPLEWLLSRSRGERWQKPRAVTQRMLAAVRVARNPGHNAAILLSTTLIWVLLSLLYYWAARIALPELTYFQALLGATAASLSFALPINGVAGIGPMQAAWAYALASTGVAWDVGIASALICHSVLLIGSILLSGLVIALLSGETKPPIFPEALSNRANSE